MDRVTKAYLDAFREEQSIESLKESDAFELFADYCVISDSYDDEFNVTDVHTGGDGDLGIDGIGTIVNGSLVNSIEDMEGLLDLNGSLDVTFCFIQAKTSSGFSGDQIMTFFDGVDEFFAETVTIPMNATVKSAYELMQKIYDNSLKFRRSKPQCRLSYVTTGQWVNDEYLSAKITKRVATLKSTGLFSDVVFTPMGADEVHASYLRSKNSVTTEFSFSNKVLLPDIVGVSESYLGVISGPEFIKILTDGAGNIRKSLFNDNVRDFQEYNPVNTDIKRTLEDDGTKGRFVVLNNGVTIVARELRTTRDKVAISEYQIVNGCQTSHVLFEQKEHLTDQVQVPLKIVATQDEDVVNSIITATNRQTQVTNEDLFALGTFAKKLEGFLSSYDEDQRLYYERRSKQYNAVPGIKKVRIITKSQQIRAFAAMFLDEPHRSISYYADLQTQVGTRIFYDGHKLEPYYVAAYAHFKLEFLFRSGGVPVAYKPARYHLLMALRYIAGGVDMPALSANKIEKYCSSICEVLWDNAQATEAFMHAASVVNEAMEGSLLTLDIAKTRTFTDSLKQSLGVST
ncbi:AIPR family protein [Streptomyces sp. NBC_00291]|uniref:AIPR family protein n=1 Tax=Streptomyces sp. NBC_00291 TaxID=2975704 RepID=UPI002251CEF7|nr:AIPR family protein [Streptomyces sp. NBC_00291]MCX5152780.1 AIPR family protein [Streptomyces sp. NBC_00291]